MSLTFPIDTVFTLTWTLTDAQGNPINNANVVATLYSGRSATNPVAVPGTAVPPINGLVLTFIANGQYSAAVPGTLAPAPDGVGYILVIDATVSGQPVYHREEPATVETAGAAVDLTTVDLVKDWIPGTFPDSSDDAVLQSCITSWSYEFLRRTGTGDMGGDYTQSPFNAVCSWDEVYDGYGTSRLMLRNRPVVSIIALIVNGVSVPQSSGFSVQGWVLDSSRRSIALRGGVLGFGSQLFQNWQSGPFRALASVGKFPPGIQNIEVQYMAGYRQTPADIVECANKVVHQNYKRRPYADEASRAMAGGGGTIRFRDWEIPPECQAVVDRYTRTL